MKMIRILRNPFALIGQGFVLGGLLFVGLDGARADTSAPTPAPTEIAAR